MYSVFQVKRQGYDVAVTWRISSANIDFKLSPSYPTHLLVPTSISDDMLEGDLFIYFWALSENYQ